jgi:hypothetical protein
MPIAKLPGGLELHLADDGKASTVPPRTELSDIQQTVVEVEGWLQKHRPSRLPSKDHLANRRRADADFWRYVDVKYWLGCFEDQYAYLSPNMPKRQSRMTADEFTQEMLRHFFPKKSN